MLFLGEGPGNFELGLLPPIYFPGLSSNSPDGITGLLAWWDATDATTMRSGVVHDDAVADNTGTLTGFDVNPYVADSPTATNRNVRDTSGNANHGRMVGYTDAELSNGTDGWISGGGIDLDGTDDYVQFTSFTQSGAFSVALRVRPDTLAIMALVGDLSSTDLITFQGVSGDTIRFNFGGGVQDFTISPAMVVDTEYSIILTRDSGNDVRCYVDGVESTTGAINQSNSATFGCWGRRNTGVYLNGTIRDCRIYSTALTAGNITYYATEGASGDDPGTGDLLDMPMDDGSATTVSQTYSIDFDATDDYVLSDPVAANSLDTTDFTIAAWVKHDSANTGYLIDTGGAASNQRMSVYVNGSNALITLVNGTSSTSANNTLPANNEWHHLAVVFTDSGDTVDVYVDGVLTESLANVGVVPANLTRVSIGASLSPSATFDGHICQAKIFNSALTANQVAALCNPSISDPVTPVGDWPCDGAIEDGDNVLAWTDATSSLVAYQLTAANQPTYDATNKALTFNGTTDFLQVDDTATLSFGNAAADNPMSIAAWGNATDATLFRVISKGDEWLLTGNASDLLGMYRYDNSGAVFIAKLSDGAITQSVWKFLAGTSDDSETAAGITVYDDAVAVAQSTAVSGSYVASHDTANVAMIGRLAAAGYANGKLGTILIYNVELSAADIALLHTYGQTYWS